MSVGDGIIIGVLIASIIFLIASVIYPKIKKYRIIVKKVERKKTRRKR